MHVAMRRLRSVFTLVDWQFPSVELDALRAEFKRIASLLGEARDWDVFVEFDPRGTCAEVRSTARPVLTT